VTDGGTDMENITLGQITDFYYACVEVVVKCNDPVMATRFDDRSEQFLAIIARELEVSPEDLGTIPRDWVFEGKVVEEAMRFKMWWEQFCQFNRIAISRIIDY
jgi:hypothetical protein